MPNSPTVVDAWTGPGRDFDASQAQALEGTDAVAGDTLLTRDASIQAILRWDLAQQSAVNAAGSIYMRGKSTGPSEYISAGLQLVVADAALGIGEVRWLWHDSGGVLRVQSGGFFRVDSGYTIITATRRWESPTKVVLRYFVGDVVIDEIESTDGDIAGNVNGTTIIGARYDGANYVDFFDGVLDELRLVEGELTPEEIEATWLRLSQYQPDGYRMMRDLMQPDLPISDDPGSRVQSDIRTMGTALGYASAQIENFRANIMPDRAYGETLERWESITKQFPRALDAIDRRRRRVVAHLAKRAGVAINGIRGALAEILATSKSSIEVLAYSPTIDEDWMKLRSERWLVNGDGVVVTKSGGAAAYDAGCAASEFFTGDCFVEWTVNATTQTRVVGLTSEASYSVDPTTYDYAIRFDANAWADEDGANKASVAGIATGDVLRIERRGSTVYYRRNGAVFYTSIASSAAPLRVCIAIATVGGLVSSLRAGTELCNSVPLHFVSKANVTTTDPNVDAYGARIVKTGVAGWNAGASSVETISGDGYVECVAVETNTSRMFGFVADDASVNYDDGDFVLFLRDDAQIETYENGSASGMLGAYAAGDVFRVERKGATVQYLKNGAVVRTSTIASSGALRVDAALNSASATLDGLQLFDAGARRAITWQNATGVRISGESLRVRSGAGSAPWDTDSPAGGLRAVMTAENPRAANALIDQTIPPQAFNGNAVVVAMEPVLLPANAEAGLVFWDWSGNNLFFFGLRNNAGAYEVGYQRFRGDGQPSDATWQVLATTSLTKHWLRFKYGDAEAYLGGLNEQIYDLSWSTVGSEESNFTTAASITWRRQVGWLGCYARTFAATGSSLDVRFAESRFRNVNSSRPFMLYALRDRSLPGDADYEAARAVIRRMRHAYTHASVIAQRSFLTDDPYSVTDGGPLGGI